MMRPDNFELPTTVVYYTVVYTVNTRFVSNVTNVTKILVSKLSVNDDNSLVKSSIRPNVVTKRCFSGVLDVKTN